MGKASPTMKLANQFVGTAKLTASGLAFGKNNSVTKNHGIDPGPIAKKTTNITTRTILSQDANSLSPSI